MAIGIVRTAWAGTSGGPGLTQLAVREGGGAFWTTTQAQNAVNAVRTFWDTVKGQMPDDVAFTVSPVVDIYNEVDGELISSVSAPTAPTSVTGTSAAVFSMASGMKVNLNTGVIRFGRRVRGSIYLVPASSVCYGANGLVLSTSRTAINAAASNLMSGLSTSGLEWCVYSRPKTGVNPRVGATSLITGVETSEKVAILRGRRD